jgi:beta-ureidopropionase / N-carbamoyl-L-amino-acid hydrolase
VTDSAGISVAAALLNLFADFPGMPTRPLGFRVAAFVEAHIEQGPELDQGTGGESSTS